MPMPPTKPKPNMRKVNSIRSDSNSEAVSGSVCPQISNDAFAREIVDRIMNEHMKYTYNGFASEQVSNIGMEIAREIVKQNDEGWINVDKSRDRYFKLALKNADRTLRITRKEADEGGYERGYKQAIKELPMHEDQYFSPSTVEGIRASSRSDTLKEVFDDLEERIKKYRRIHAGQTWASAMFLEMKSVWNNRELEQTAGKKVKK